MKSYELAPGIDLGADTLPVIAGPCVIETEEQTVESARWLAGLVGAQERIGLINGALDPVSGKHAYDRWCETLPDARHHLLPNVGHYPQVEAPADVAAKALEWLD